MKLVSRLQLCGCVLACVVLGSITGCERGGDQSSSGDGAGSATNINAQASLFPAGLFLVDLPADAKDVKSAKAAAKPGDRVVIRGRIGGSLEPFVEGRAIFTLMDKALPACSDNPDDHCTTPWDYCCESPEDIALHAATIRVVGPDGAPLRAGLKGEGGLKELSEVVVVGEVAEDSEGGNLVVNAVGMYVVSAANGS